MAKQSGDMKFTGTDGNITLYQLGGKYYARSRSGLTVHRVRTSPAFGETMRQARLLGAASRIASALYQKLPRSVKQRKLFQQLTGEARSLLAGGMDPGRVRASLQEKINRTLV